MICGQLQSGYEIFERIFSVVYFQHVRTGGEGGIRTPAPYVVCVTY